MIVLVNSKKKILIYRLWKKLSTRKIIGLVAIHLLYFVYRGCYFSCLPALTPCNATLKRPCFL